MKNAGRVRVLRVIARLNIGGPALHVAALADLDPDRFETLLVHGSIGPGEQDMADLLVGRPVQVMALPELGRAVRPWHDAVAFSRLLDTIRRFRPHVIHTHTAKAGALGRLAGAWARRGAHRRGAPRSRLVHTFHGHVFHGYFNPAVSRGVVVAERGLARLSDRILAVSEQIRADLVERYRVAPAGKVTVVPLGLDLDPFLRTDSGDRLRAELGIGADVFLIGCVGRLVAIKNHELLLDALVAARARGLEHALLVIVGDGDRRPALEAAVGRRRLDRHVRFLGWRRDLPQVYEALDVAVLSSRNEGTPVSLIEAMAAGRPVIATDVGGVRDVVESGAGIVVPSGDVTAFAEALVALAAESVPAGNHGRGRADCGPAALLEDPAAQSHGRRV